MITPYSVPRWTINNNLKMNIKNKIYHTAYFLLFGIIVGILRWSICIVDTNGTMDFTPFLQAFLLIVALLLFVILDIILHKIALRAISITILLCFNIWSYTYYFIQIKKNLECRFHNSKFLVAKLVFTSRFRVMQTID